MKFFKSLSISIIALFCIISVASAYNVRNGDTLWKIAQNSNFSLTDLLQINPQIENPNLIYPGQEINTEMFGAVIPSPVALFEDSLQAKITSSQTTLTLVRGTNKQGASLSGTYGFIIDEGSSVEEFVICSVSGTAGTSCQRGIDVTTGQTEVASLKQEHRRGASVKISDWPFLGVINQILNGNTTTPAVIVYASSTSIGLMNGNTLATKTYVDNVGAGGFTASNIGGGFTIRANGGSPETLDINTSTASKLSSFIIEGGKFVINTSTNELIDTFWKNSYNNTTTKDILTIGKATTTQLVVGTNPTGNHSQSGLWVQGNATTTGSMDVEQICFSGANCVSSINVNYQNTRAATTTLSSINGPATEISVATTTISAGSLGTTGGFKTSIRGYYNDGGSAGDGKVRLMILAGSATTAIGQTAIYEFNMGISDQDWKAECDIWPAGKTEVLMVNCAGYNFAANTSTAAVTTYSIDTTAAIQAVWVWVTPANASSVRIDKGYAEIFKP